MTTTLSFLEQSHSVVGAFRTYSLDLWKDQ